MILLLVLILYIFWRDYIRKAPPEPSRPEGAPLTIWDRSQVPDRGRIKALGYTIVGLYAISVTGLYFFWYKKARLNKFHWFDDRKEWNQIDKAGHIYGGYFQTVWGYELLRWCGLSNKQSAVIAAMLGISIQSSIEIMDGYSSKWGASYSDLGANFTGAFIAAAQYWMWEEQRIMLKSSYEGGDYPKGELGERSEELFGTDSIGRRLKDYNHITLWVSVNPSKFHPGIYPDWLCYSVGYSAENLYGGFENKWTDKDGNKHDRTDLPRMRVLNFSLDADLPKLSNGNKAELAVFKMMNIFKVPFPRYQYKWEADKVVNPNPNGWGREE